MVHGLTRASFVLNCVRRTKVAIDQDVLSSRIVAANLDITKAQREMKVDPQQSDDLDQPHDYPFVERSTFLWSHLIGKLNMNLHDKTVGIGHCHGF